MKRHIDLGVAVDTGTGDYLRRGGDKVNKNFDDIYMGLGDGEDIQPSNLGIIYHVTAIDGTTLDATLGKIYAIDTSQAGCTVNMPAMSETDIGRSITFIDPYGTWNLNNVTFNAATGTSFGTVSQTTVSMRYAKTVMTYINPSMWLFNAGQRLDQFSDIAEASRYVRYRKVEVDGQTDFTDIFPVRYNDSAIDVIINGVDLYYGENLTSESEFGSIDPNDPDNIQQLNGFDIRLKHGARKGDIIKFVTYLKSTGTSPTSVEQHNVKLVDTTSSQDPLPGEVLKRDLSGDFIDITLVEMGGESTDQLNPDATNVFVNGVRLTRRGEAGYPKGTCSLPEFADENSCSAAGGVWTDVWDEYELILDPQSKLNTIRISTNSLGTTSVDENYINVETYNFILGTISDLDTVINETDLRYMRTMESVQRRNKISYTDIAAPSNETAQNVPGTENTRFDTYTKFLETIYPIGSIYLNAHNKANPQDFMGFGTWVRYAQGRAIVGWDSRTDALGNYDPDFGLNNNDLDEVGQPRATAGATRGTKTVTLSPSNIPLLQSANKWLKKALGITGFFKNYGDLGGSNVDPISSYNEENIELGMETPTPTNNIQPSVTVYCWIRVQ